LRTLHKRAPPSALTEWRAPRLAARRGEGMECSYGELRRDPDAIRAEEDALLAEQGSLCAYTGHRIRITKEGSGATEQRVVGFHMEHVIPQKHCAYGEDTEHRNLVACWPRPNCGFEPAYGARKKGDWPGPEERHRFVSPLQPGCSERFVFNRRGKIAPAKQGDDAAGETIRRLGLADGSLTALRQGAIEGALCPGSRPIQLKDARRLLKQMESDAARLDRGEDVELSPFCFAIQQALAKEIRKLEGILGKK